MLEENQIVSLSRNIFDNLMSLERVCLANNPISILPNLITGYLGGTNSKLKILI